MQQHLSYALNSNGQVFHRSGGSEKIVLDFDEECLQMIDKRGECTQIPFPSSYQKRGDFYLFSEFHFLWVCKTRTDVPAEWNNGKKPGFAPDTSVVILFTPKAIKYRLRLRDLGFSAVKEYAAEKNDLRQVPETQAWYGSSRFRYTESKGGLLLPNLFLEGVNALLGASIDICSGTVARTNSGPIASHPPVNL